MSWALNCAWPPGRLTNSTSQRAVVSAVSRPRSSSTSASARSIPAVTPAEVYTSPSRTKIGSASTSTSGWRSASSAQLAQCVVARRPFEQPGRGEQERAGAHAGDPARAPGRVAERREEALVVLEREHAGAAGHHQRVDRAAHRVERGVGREAHRRGA